MSMFDRFFLILITIVLIPPVFSQESELKDFKQTIGGSQLDIEMVAIIAGNFSMGSPASEEKRNINDIDNLSSSKDVDIVIDAISGATIPYVDMCLEMGASEG